MAIMQQALMVVAVLGLLLVIGKRQSTRQLRQLERLALTPQHGLHLVRVAGRAVLIASSPTSCNLIDSWPLPDIESSVPGAGIHSEAAR
jgi:hypothetical protein